ncbi:MAG: hypothetical protein ACREE7_10020 [Dongiaceae bacterium]
MPLGTSLSPGAAALAQTICGRHSDILAEFAETYSEVPGAVGLTDRGALIDVLVSPSGSWTMLLTTPGGPSCVIGTGQAWQVRQAAAPEPGA